MKCTGCFKELSEGKKAYATVVGSIEEIDYEDVGLGLNSYKTNTFE